MFKKIFYKYYDKSLPTPTSDERAFLVELQNTFLEFPEFETKNTSASEAEWLGNLNTLKKLVLENNPREFLRWELIRKTMFLTSKRVVQEELKYLKQLPDWDTRWRQAIKETYVGRPKPCALYPQSSGNLIHHAYHIAQFEEKTKSHIEDTDFVFEFGAGYGGMCRLIFNLGFRGKYLLYDLKPFSALQVYFLKTLGLPVCLENDFVKQNEPAITCLSNFNRLESLLTKQISASNKMFVGTWSISETPVSLRQSILPLVNDFQTFLIGYQDIFRDVDNITFFNRWASTNNHLAWKNWPIPHIPKNHYLFGKRK